MNTVGAAFAHSKVGVRTNATMESALCGIASCSAAYGTMLLSGPALTVNIAAMSSARCPEALEMARMHAGVTHLVRRHATKVEHLITATTAQS